jgi:hypothetical protein
MKPTRAKKKKPRQNKGEKEGGKGWAINNNNQVF